MIRVATQHRGGGPTAVAGPAAPRWTSPLAG
jgi:hypothetical protein